MTERDGFIRVGYSKRPLADVPKLPLAATFHKGSRQDFE